MNRLKNRLAQIQANFRHLQRLPQAHALDVGSHAASQTYPHMELYAAAASITGGIINLRNIGATATHTPQLLFFRRTGSLRPTSGPFSGKRSRSINSSGGAAGVERHKRKPPRGMYINHDDIVALASPDNEPASANRGDDLLAGMDREINTLLSQVSCPKSFQPDALCMSECLLCRLYSIISQTCFVSLSNYFHN